MRVLGIDSATSTASVALVENGQVLAEGLYPPHFCEKATDNPGAKSNHAEIILPLIDSVLRQARIELAYVDGIAVSIGPGSFTGVRIGVSTAKGLAYGAAIPTVGISTLHANAARVSDFDGVLCSLLDARKNEVYAALFRKNGKLLNRITDDVVVPVPKILKVLSAVKVAEPCLFVGDGAMACRALVENLGGPRVNIVAEKEMSSVAMAVARLSEGRFHDNDVPLLRKLTPVYLRRPGCESYGKILSY
ncbi:MAG: tRNA (adenosine(37)-N6)-threonylcarbamoyltransferase complex dimerization subunit type 1 TsaB [Deltaproteobacteria bacterium]|nr:tRNA (adenosine(37)-N6)-threonylcarbamoyltransferase complex dimerization subunit type 1 TsaB [Deltaproteobacteria bacterium]